MEFDAKLADELISSINARVKGPVKTAHYLDDPEIISDVTDWISTGSSVLDVAISNRPNAGLPVGRIIELTGLEASGKSLMAAHIAAETQKKGGIAVFFDTEAATDRTFFRALGVDTSKLLYIPLETIEEVFENMEFIISKVRASSSTRLVTLIVDSVMGASTKIEISGDYDKEGYATAKAILMSKGMRKITNMIARQNILAVFTNQLRTVLNAGLGDKWTTSGGKALPFHASVRLRLQSIGQIKAKIDGIETVIGTKTKVKVVKNRLGPPLREVVFNIYYASGIDDYGSWLEVMTKHGMVQQKGAWYTYTIQHPDAEVVDPDSGEIAKKQEMKFQSKHLAQLLEHNPKIKQEIYDELCKVSVMKYKVNEDFGIDDLQVDTDFEPEDG